MTTLSIDINDGLLLKALAAAVAKNITLEAHLEEVLLEAEETSDDPAGVTDLDSAIDQALARATALSSGKLFQLQDLFSSQEWSSVASPRWFGRKFRPAVEKAGVATFEDKTQTNKAIYRRN